MDGIYRPVVLADLREDGSRQKEQRIAGTMPVPRAPLGLQRICVEEGASVVHMKANKI